MSTDVFANDLDSGGGFPTDENRNILGHRKSKLDKPILLVVVIILVSYALFFVFQISTEINVRQMVLEESKSNQEQDVIRMIRDLDEVKTSTSISSSMDHLMSTEPPLQSNDGIVNMGVIDDSGLYAWNSDKAKIDSKLMSPSEMISSTTTSQPQQFERPLSIVHRMDGSEYLTTIMAVPNLESGADKEISPAGTEHNSLYLVVSTPLSGLLGEIDNILFGQRIQNFSLVAGVSLLTVIMAFFMNRNSRLKRQAQCHATELEESNKTVKTQQFKLQEANIELRKLDELKDRFISVASHELKNPIQPILLCAELAKKGEMDKEKALEIVLVNARRLRQLASDLLDVSKIDSGSFRCVPDKVRINEMVSELVKSSALMGNSNVKLEISIDQDVEIDGDRVRLFQVFSNLINNSLKFTAEGYIRLETKTFPERNAIEISIKDSGTGIPEEILPNLFGKFISYSADQRNRHGSGLGLYIAKAIVEAHNGEISAYNNKPEKGATFRVSLPIRNERLMETLTINSLT